MTRLGLAVLAGLVLVAPAAAAPIEVGATTCTVDYHARADNLACSASVPGGAVTLTGALVVVERASGGAMRFGYDASGRLSRAEGPFGTHSYLYGADGRLVARSDDARGEVVRYAYDDLGRLVTAGATSLAYAGGTLARSSTADGGSTDYSYDRRGDLVALADTAAGTASFTYAAPGLLSLATAGDETVGYSYDRLGRPVERSGATDASFAYAGRSRRLETSVDSRSGTVAFDYDRAGRLVAIAGPSGTTAFRYDLAGRLLSTTAPDGARISFAYDAAGRLTLVVPDPGDEVLVSFLEGDPDRPIVLGSIYTDGNSVTLTPDGRLLTCRDCP